MNDKYCAICKHGHQHDRFLWTCKLTGERVSPLAIVGKAYAEYEPASSCTNYEPRWEQPKTRLEQQ